MVLFPILFGISLIRLAPSDAVSASCECILFDSTYGKEFGLFTSPNWPVPYEDNIECLLYTFVAEAHQMVEITFDDFDIQRTNLECIFGDFVKLFLHLDEPAVNERTTYNAILCGRILDIEQTHYSSGSSLIFEFHSDWRKSNSTGFSGTYRFLRTFQTDGHLVAGSTCNYEISSEMLNKTRGKFFSPQYPSSYPRDVVCGYHFNAQPTANRVRILFEQIRLQKGDLSCLNSPDVILAYDGSNKSSPIIGQFCNTNSFVELVSTASELYIEFVSHSHFPGQGFKAAYVFEQQHHHSSDSQQQQRPSAAAAADNIEVPSSSSYLETIRRTTDYLTTTDMPAPAHSCGQEISSDTAKNGTFTSPGYPDPYPSDIHCVYEFTGRGKERVQIIFTDFDLHLPHEPPKDCESVDAVMVFITINGQKERIDNFCGNMLPPQLMSNGPSMRVEFRSFHTSPEVKGFRAIYRFVTDFGISGAQQDTGTVCGFEFKSEDRQNGTFMSPNFPGYYPRDTECYYFFKGRSKERVHIKFSHFDVDGIPPCTTSTASDYVEFSNFVSVDRKIPRHCGDKKPNIIDSDSDYFRVTFKSNEKFDATGFEAFYQFKPSEDPLVIRRVSTTTKANSGACCSENLLVLLVIASTLVLFLTSSSRKNVSSTV